MSLTIENLKVTLQKKEILHGINLDAKEGEFISLLGASGCGKTTLLKSIAGLLDVQDGNIRIRKESVLGVAPEKRGTIIVFQDLRLFPHMTVEKNIAYVPNLLNRKDKKRTAQAVVKWMGIVGLDDSLRSRYPSELSGGQQQRVGIARALAASPDILLMDEPFGAVDEITRGSLQDEIARIHRETGITILFVTHDIGEALKLGTKVLVMDQGSVQQFAPPREILHDPATDYVKKLVEKERRRCHLPEEKLGDCAYSGAI